MKWTLAFDVYGTLINTSGILPLLQTMIGERATDFMNTWRNQQLAYSFRRGLMDQYVKFSVCTEEALMYTCIFFQKNLSAVQKEKLLEAYRSLPAFEKTQEELQRIKANGHRLFAFSNGEQAIVHKMLDNAGLLDALDGIVSLEPVDLFKPSPLAYTYFNAKTNSEPSSSCLISSNSFDVLGAKAYGMKAIWLKRSSEAILDPWDLQPDYAIASIDEIEDLTKQLSIHF